MRRADPLARRHGGLGAPPCGGGASAARARRPARAGRAPARPPRGSRARRPRAAWRRGCACRSVRATGGRRSRTAAPGASAGPPSAAPLPPVTRYRPRPVGSTSSPRHRSSRPGSIPPAAATSMFDRRHRRTCPVPKMVSFDASVDTPEQCVSVVRFCNSVSQWRITDGRERRPPRARNAAEAARHRGNSPSSDVLRPRLSSAGAGSGGRQLAALLARVAVALVLALAGAVQVAVRAGRARLAGAELLALLFSPCVPGGVSPLVTFPGPWWVVLRSDMILLTAEGDAPRRTSRHTAQDPFPQRVIQRSIHHRRTLRATGGMRTYLARSPAT